MKTMLAVVNSEGKFVRWWTGLTFDTWALPNNERASVFLGKLYGLQQEYNSLIEVAKSDSIAIKEREFKAFVIECRKVRDAVIELKSQQASHDSAKRLVDSQLNRAQLKLREVIGNAPKPSHFPTDEEVSAHNKLVEQAQQKVNDALAAVRQTDSAIASWQFETNQKIQELKTYTERHDAMKLALDRLKGVVNTHEENSLNSGFGLVG